MSSFNFCFFSFAGMFNLCSSGLMAVYKCGNGFYFIKVPLYFFLYIFFYSIYCLIFFEVDKFCCFNYAMFHDKCNVLNV